MATRYLIGTGARNWNDTANWSATSGGLGGASVPTMNDDVYFDSNSGTGTVTVNAIANMRDCTFTQTQLITLANAAYAFNIYGNWTLCDNAYLNTSFTGTGYVYLKATTSVNITSNGCTRGWNRLYFDGVGGTWTNQDNMNIASASFNLVNGEWKTNNYSIITTGNFATPLDGVKTLTLGTSNFYVNSFLEGYNYNFNYDTSTVITKSMSSLYFRIFYNFIMNGKQFVLTANLTVLNSLIFTGLNSSNDRLLVNSNTIGTPRTITCNGTVTASNVDFRYIVGAGTANWDLSAITGGSGDCGGNSGITFTPAQTQYFKHTLGAVNWSDTTKWFSNYERTIAGRVPLPQDDAIFDENSFTGASTLTVNVLRTGGLNMADLLHLITIMSSETSSLYIHKAYLPSINCNCLLFNISLVNYNEITYIDLNGIEHGIIRLAYGNYIATSDIVCMTFETGIGGNASSYAKFDLNDNNLTVNGNWLQLNDGTITTYWGNGNIIINAISSNTLINMNRGLVNVENAKFIINSRNIISISGITINTASEIFYLEIAGSSSFYQFNLRLKIKELVIRPDKNVKFTSGSNNYIGKLTAIGTPTNPIKIDSTTASRFNLVKTGSEPNECNFIDISNSNASPSGSWPAGYNSNDMGNNAGWEFNTDDFVPQIINL